MVSWLTIDLIDPARLVISEFLIKMKISLASYAKHVIDGISEVKELVSIMLKGDNGIFFRQLTDLIFGQNITNALPFLL